MASLPKYGHERPVGYKAAAKMRDAALSHIEQAVLAICEQAAADGRPMDSVEQIMDKLGVNSFSTVPGIMRRLEDKGFIRRNIYQRGRQVCIVATGECTAEPSNTAPHWRLRPKTDPVPTPAIHKVRERQPIASEIELEARKLGKPMAEFLADLVYIGFHAYQVEQGA